MGPDPACVVRRRTWKVPVARSVVRVSDRQHHRPMKPGAEFFAEIIGGEDPARVSEAADRAANLLVRGARGSDDPAVAERVLRLADTEGIETIAEVWAGSPADSLAGCLWRLFVLRSWVYADPATVAREYDAGRRTAQVAQVVAGVADPPGPDELRTMVDEVLRGIAGSDFADVLFRAAAFARVVATGRAALDDAHRGRGAADAGAGRAARGGRPRGAGARPGLRLASQLVHAGPGAPHGAWPLVAADFGTRGCRGPACTFIVTTLRGDAFQVLLRNGP